MKNYLSSRQVWQFYYWFRRIWSFWIKIERFALILSVKLLFRSFKCPTCLLKNHPCYYYIIIVVGRKNTLRSIILPNYIINYQFSVVATKNVIRDWEHILKNWIPKLVLFFKRETERELLSYIRHLVFIEPTVSLRKKIVLSVENQLFI